MPKFTYFFTLDSSDNVLYNDGGNEQVDDFDDGAGDKLLIFGDIHNDHIYSLAGDVLYPGYTPIGGVVVDFSGSHFLFTSTNYDLVSPPEPRTALIHMI